MQQRWVMIKGGCVYIYTRVCKRGSITAQELLFLFFFHFVKIIHFNFSISSSYIQTTTTIQTHTHIIWRFLLPFVPESFVNRYWIKIKAGHLRFAQHQCKMFYIYNETRPTHNTGWLCCCWWVFLSLVSRVSSTYSTHTCARSHI